jgi:hypothetical protein
MANRKFFFDQIAKEYDFDPLVCENWYHFDVHNVTRQRGGHYIMDLYRESLADALVDVYPNIGLDYFRFAKLKSYKLRTLFEGIAVQKGFDPLIAANWLKLKRADIVSLTNKRYLVNHHQLMRMVQQTFPNIQYDYSTQNNVLWSHAECRKVMDSVANMNGFDPTDIEAWYHILPKHFKNHKAGAMVLAMYNNNVYTALTTVYLELKFDKKRFTSYK